MCYSEFWDEEFSGRGIDVWPPQDRAVLHLTDELLNLDLDNVLARHHDEAQVATGHLGPERVRLEARSRL